MPNINSETMKFVRNWVKESYEEHCKTPAKCAPGMYPVSCDECHFNVNDAFNEAHTAIRELRHKHPAFTEIQMVNDHYVRARSDECVVCGGDVWCRTTVKPFSWESDVRITTFNFKCRTCGNEWVEHDSD